MQGLTVDIKIENLNVWNFDMKIQKITGRV